MDRAERTGLALAGGAHVLFFAALSAGLFSAARPPQPNVEPPPMDVSFVEDAPAALEGATTEAQLDEPAPAESPEPSPVVEASPAPTPLPPTPVPTPLPPTPVPPAPAPAPRAVQRPAPAPRPAPRAAAQRPAPKQAAAPGPKRAAPAPAKAAPAPPRPRGGRLGADLLAGITPEGSGNAERPQAASVSAADRSSLVGAIQRQVRPCYDLGALSGTPATRIVTTLDLRLARDGSVSALSVVGHSGVDDENRRYVQQMDDVVQRAVRRCAPLKLPAELYQGGWDRIRPRFRPT